MKIYFKILLTNSMIFYFLSSQVMAMDLSGDDKTSKVLVKVAPLLSPDASTSSSSGATSSNAAASAEATVGASAPAPAPAPIHTPVGLAGASVSVPSFPMGLDRESAQKFLASGAAKGTDSDAPLVVCAMDLSLLVGLSFSSSGALSASSSSVGNVMAPAATSLARAPVEGDSNAVNFIFNVNPFGEVDLSLNIGGPSDVMVATPLVRVPDPFPGHTSKPIKEVVQTPSHFDFRHYSQEREKGEGACAFNSFLAGLMYTSYGRELVRNLFVGQDHEHVYIRFYFPPHLNVYSHLYEKRLKSQQDLLGQIRRNARERPYHEMQVRVIQEGWQRLLSCSHPRTLIQVPKKYVRGNGSFPANPSWVNILQQAYMRIVKNPFMADSNILSDSLEITSRDKFHALIHFRLGLGPRIFITDLLNTQHDGTFEFLPLVPIPLRAVQLLLDHKKMCLDFEAINKRQGFKTIVDFCASNGMSKAILAGPNVMQFSAAGHAVALFIGEDKVFYYDNVIFPPQRAVYGQEGPIYEEAHHFKGRSMGALSEEEFLTCLFKEICLRRMQVSKIRAKNPASEDPGSEVVVRFFSAPLSSGPDMKRIENRE